MEVSGKLREKEDITELCEPCKVANLSNQADGFCKDCEEFMCQTCFGYHLRARSCRNHVLDPLNKDQLQRKIRAREEKCKTHISEPVKYYCSLHDFMGCGDCIVTGHGKCEPKFIRDIAFNLEESSEFKSIISQLQKSDGETADRETRIARYREENKMLMAKAIRGIKVFRRDIDCWLDKMETTIEAEVRKISDENENKFSQLQEMIVAVNDDIDRIKKLLDSNIHHDENLFMRMIECKPEVGVIDNTLSEIKSKLVFQRYIFEEGEQMKGMLMSFDKLGIIKVFKLTENDQSTEDVKMSPFATEPEPEDFLADETKSTYNVKEFWYPLRAELEEELEYIRQKAVSDKDEKDQAYHKLETELEKELEKTRQMAVTEKEEKVSLQQAYNKLKTELEKELEKTRQMAVTEKEEKVSLQQAYNKLETELEKELEKTRQMAITEKREKVGLQQAYNKVKTELEKELEKSRQMAVTEKEEKVSLQQAYNLLKKELEAQEGLLTREREHSVVVTKERDQNIDLMKQEVSSLNDLNTSLKSQLNSRNKEFDVLESTYQARQEQDNNKIKSLQSELSKISENHKKECKRLSDQIHDLQRKSEMKTYKYKLPDPRAAGFDFGQRVKGIYTGRTGTVTAIDPSGYVDVKWDSGGSDRLKTGAEGGCLLKLL